VPIEAPQGIIPTRVVTGEVDKMSFDRQVALLFTILTAAVVFIGCTFYFALSVKISALIAACVLIAGLACGRSVGKILDFF
jgi:hypothetical protein